MTAQLGIAILIGIGGFLQVMGVLLVVKEIRSDRRRAQELRAVKVHARGGSVAAVAVTAVGEGKADPEPSLPDRVTALERQQQAHHRLLTARGVAR
jgi:hypothetical protein